MVGEVDLRDRAGVGVGRGSLGFLGPTLAITFREAVESEGGRFRWCSLEMRYICCTGEQSPGASGKWCPRVWFCVLRKL